MNKELCKRCRKNVVKKIEDTKIRNKFEWSKTDDILWKRKSVICFESDGKLVCFKDKIPDCCIYKVEHVVTK